MTKADGHCELVAIIERPVFSKEIKELQAQKELTTKDRTSRLYRLNPFLDHKGILRVGGRLEHAALHSHIKHPVILPKTSHITKLLTDHYQRVRHQGCGMTINELRSNDIWILGCGQVVSLFIYNCVKCRRLRCQTEDQKLANLPSERMETTSPFSYCAMDYFGPFVINKGRKELKCYGLLFTCLCSRAVQIELLDDLSTDAFLNSIHAFFALRGNVRQLQSDQGTNFVGARREFLEAVKEMDQECLKQLGCEFVMNPPQSIECVQRAIPNGK